MHIERNARASLKLYSELKIIYDIFGLTVRFALAQPVDNDSVLSIGFLDRIGLTFRSKSMINVASYLLNCV
jgi:hypothetical protein